MDTRRDLLITRRSKVQILPPATIEDAGTGVSEYRGPFVISMAQIWHMLASRAQVSRVMVLPQPPPHTGAVHY